MIEQLNSRIRPLLDVYEELKHTLKLAKKLVKEKKISVDDCKQPTLGKYFGIGYVAHSAINDVTALKDIYFKMHTLED